MTGTDYTPQFYDPKTALTPVISALTGDNYVKRTENRVTNTRSPEDYLLLWDQRLRREAKETRKLNEMYVTMHRRYRGVTISDQFGYFGTRPETQGRWIDYNPDLDGEVHPINVVRPDLKANTAALLQMNVSIDVEPANKESRLAENARRLQTLIDFFERDCWMESDRTLLFDGIQKEGTWLVENYFDEERSHDQNVIVPVEYRSHFLKFDCDACDRHEMRELPTDDRLAAQEAPSAVACPYCNSPAKMEIESRSNYGADEQRVRTREIAHRFWSAFNFFIDRKGARGRGLQSARYLSTIDLVERSDLEDQYPHVQFHAPYEWAYSLKCQHALATADWSILYASWMPSSDANEWDIFQRSRNFLHESAYRNYIAPTDWEFRGSDGRQKFSIRRGQTWPEAVRESMGEDVRGFCFITVNEQVIDILASPDEETNFRRRFTDVHFDRDSGSYLSVPHWSSVQLQDDITLFNTIKTDMAARNSIQPVWYNSTVFDVNDFGKEYIPSKDGALDVENSDINRYVFKPMIATASDAINEHLVFMLGIHDQFSDRTPALRGETQPGQPAAAQRQQLEQSYGMLTSPSKSFAQMKVSNAKQKLSMAFENWTLEQFQTVASAQGEEWNEADVKDLVNTDLERDVLIDYTPGSEVPQGNQIREMKFYTGLQQSLPFISAGIVKPEVIQQILKKIDEFADLNLDLSGEETADALAQKRYQQLVGACKEYAALPRRDIENMKAQTVAQEPVVDPQTGEPAMDETTMRPALQPITAWDILNEELMTQADIFISPIEDFETQRRFFVAETVREMAKPKPNYTLCEMMTTLVSQLSAVLAETMQATIAASPEMQSAENNREDQIKQADAERTAKTEDDSAAYEREKEKLAYAEAGRENDREFERERMAHDLLMADAQSAAR